MRRLTCTRCGDTLQVYEEPIQFIDPDRYLCGQCMQPVPGQLELDPERPPETVRYDPDQAAWPDGY